MWGERALVVLIPGFTDVTGEPKGVAVMVAKVLCEVRDILLHEIAEGQDQKTPHKHHSKGYRFQVLAASSWWALTVPGWEKSLHSLYGLWRCSRTTEWIIPPDAGGHWLTCPSFPSAKLLTTGA